MRFTPRPRVLHFGPGENTRTYSGPNKFVDTWRAASPTQKPISWSGEAPQPEAPAVPQSEPETPHL